VTTAAPPQGHHGRIAAVALTELDGQRLVVSAGEDGMVAAWEVEGSATPHIVVASGGTATALTVATRRKEPVVVTGWGDGSVTVHDLRSGDLVHRFEGHTPGAYVTALVAFELEGAPTLASADTAGLINVRNLESGDPGGQLTPHTPGLPVFTLAVAEAGDRRVLVSGSRDGSVAASEVAGLRGLWQVEGAASVMGLAPWRYEREPVVACGADDGTLVLRDPTSGREVLDLGHLPPILALAGKPVGGLAVLASGHRDGTLRVWLEGSRDPFSGEPRLGEVRAIALSDAADRVGPVVLVGDDDGRVRTWHERAPEPAPVPGRPPDKVDWLADAPGDADLLQRKPLASALGHRLVRISEQDRSAFLVHLDGAWGTGKSTLLRFLRAELERAGWLVVDFDAWRQSRIGPPWWALLVALRDAIASGLSRRRRTSLRLAESWTRIRRGGAPYLFAVAVLLAIVIGLLVLLGKPSWTSVGDTAKSLSAVVAAIGTLWAGGKLASRFLLWESARGAVMYEQTQAKPMESLADHFAWLLARAGRPVMFFVDDLDRCPAEYVVELLEAVQTLIRGASDRVGTLPPGPYFVVAADGSWLRTSYEKHYAEFQGAVAEPGRPLGYLFLDKLFQLTVTVPRVASPEKARYLRGLLRTSADGAAAPGDVARVREQIRGSRTDEEVISALQTASPAAQRALAPEAVERLSAPAVEEATEHALQAFADLLDPNPRAMKRFVNAYGIARVVLTLESTLVSSDTLALWTILRSRWPMLAEQLAREPELVASIASPDGQPTDLGFGLQRPRDAAEVRRVITFPRGGPLTPELVRACAGGSGHAAGAQAPAANPSA
jgi:hypothetical protein